ncbi:MAG: Undecaprenyl-diphosphatase, partial [uncultured Actinomycetospora sp.]
GLARGRGAGHRAGTDRVPAGVLVGAPAHHLGVLLRQRRGRGVHRRHPARHRDRGAHLLLLRHLAPAPGLVRGPRPARGARLRLQARLVRDPRLDPDRRARAGVRGRDQGPGPQPLPQRHRADRLRARPGRGRALRPAASRARPAHAARRDRHGLRAGDGADPGRVALRRHDHRGPVPGARARGRRALLVPARPARGVRLRADPDPRHPRAERRGRAGQPRRGPEHPADDRRDGDRVRSGLRLDRLAAALRREPHDLRLRLVPGPAGPRGAARRQQRGRPRHL